MKEPAVKKNYIARFLELICILCIPVIIVLFLMKWFSGNFPIYSDAADSIKQTRLYAGIGYWHIGTHAKQIPLMFIRITASLIDSISLILFIWGSICFIRLLRLYYRDEIFSAHTLALYATISRIAFVWTLYSPIKFTLLSMVTTLANPTGQQIIAVAISSNDLYHIFITGFFVWITSIMKTAYKLKQEQELTV